MAINHETVFGRNQGQASNNNNSGKGNKPAAQVWLNIGYMAGEGENAKFVSLIRGIPLDTLDMFKTNISDKEFGMFLGARNELFADFMFLANGLKPGEETFITPDFESIADPEPGKLYLQLRRVDEEKAEAPVDASVNPYARRRAA